MKILYLLFFFLLTNFLMADAYARGGGLNYCGYLINTINQHSQYSGMWKQWITGFVSGYNFRNETKHLSHLEDDLIFYAVRDRCILNQNETVLEATIWVINNK